MATAKKASGKSGRRTTKPMNKASARTGKKSASPAKAPKRGPQKVAKKSTMRKATAKKATAKKATTKNAAKNAPAKNAPAKKRTPANAANGSANPLSRVARVAKEIAHQTTVAVSEGIDKAKEVGGSIVERVTS